jgi:heterodisulfide reductase subunit B2
MKYSYYPGCSLERNASAYHKSTMAIAGPLGLEFNEVEDWNCCGATEYVTVDMLPAYALVARNLAIAADQNGAGTLVAPCSACYLNLRKTDHYLAESPEFAGKINTALAAGGLHYKPSTIKTRHLLDIVVNDVGYEAVKAQVKRPLKGLKVAPYYGCLIVRPAFDGLFDDPEYPVALDRLMRALGAEVVDFPLKAHCCGGHMTQISQEVALEMLRRLLKNADDYSAHVIATLCPMCQLNLDMYQPAVNRRFQAKYELPVLYFTQLMGLAFGLEPEAVGIGRDFVDSTGALAQIGTEEEAPQPKRKRPPKDSLPMPTMLQGQEV